MSDKTEKQVGNPQVTGYTIDGPTTRDIDDAVWILRAEEHDRPRDHLVVQVHIANVAFRVPREHTFDVLAREAVASVYRPGKTIPMLPATVSEGVSSLFANAWRQTMTIEIELDANLETVGLARILPTQLFSRAQLTFADIPLLLGDPKHPLHEQVRLAVYVAETMLERRRARGALALYDLNNGWATTEEGALKKLAPHSATIGYVVVQELMILANAEVARLCAEKEIPVLFRNHQARAHAPARAEILEQIKLATTGPIDIDALREYVHLAVGRAEYGTVLRGHYGLNLPAYVHATSPIRRYADLVTQRQLMAYAVGKAFPHTRDELTEIATRVNTVMEERRTERATREKVKADTQAEKAIDRGQLRRLDAVGFERVVKVASRSGADPSPEFIEEFTRRLANGNCTPLDQFQVLVAAPPSVSWKVVKKLVIDHLNAYPFVGPSICSVATSLVGWESVRFETTHTGPDHEREFVTKAMIGGAQGEGRGPTAKLAQQRATVHILAKTAGVKTEVLSEPKRVVVTDLQEKRVVDVGKQQEKVDLLTVAEALGAEIVNAVSVLQERCQGLAKPLPEYSFERYGSDHVPAFRCTVRALGKEATREANGQKINAKQAAARALLEILHGGK